MSMAGSIRAGAAYVEIFADKNPLVRGLNAAKADIAGWAGKLKGMGGSAFGGALDKIGELVPMGGLVKAALSPAGMFTGFLGLAAAAAEGGDAVMDLSLQTGIAVGKLGSLRYAASQTGLGDEGLAGLLFRLQGEIGQAATGAGEAAQKFAKFGLSAQALSQMAPDDQLRAIAERLAGVTDQTERAAMARELLGKGGGKALPFLLELTELEARARELGFDNISAETAKAGEQFSKLLGDVKLMAKGIGSTIGNTVIPVLREYVVSIIGGLKSVRDWAKEHKGLIVSVFKVSALIVGVGGAFVAAGMALSAFGSLIGGVVAGITAIGTVISTVMGGFAMLAGIPALLGAGFAALASPVGLFVLGLLAVGVALGAGVAAWLAWTDAGQATLNQMRGAWDTFKGDLLTTWGGIVDAISAGDIGLAWGVAMAGISLEWARFVAFFKDAWSSVSFVFTRTFLDAWAGTKAGFAAMVSYMRSLWSSFSTWSSNKWADAQQAAGNVLLDALAKVGILSAEEAKIAKGDIAGQADAKRAGNAAADNEEQAALKREYDADIKRIEDERKVGQGINEQAWDEERKKREADLAEKKQALDDLRQKAADAAKPKEPGVDAVSGSAGSGPKADALKGPTTTYGSFSGAAAGLMGGGEAPLVQIGRDQLAVAKRNEALLEKVANDGGMI